MLISRRLSTRGKITKTLNIYSIPLQLQNALGKLYKGTKSRVISPDDATDYFDIPVEVLTEKPNQNGFTPRRLTITYILALRRI